MAGIDVTSYIDDIVEGVRRVIDRPAKADSSWSGDSPCPGTSTASWRLYNIGNNEPIELMDFIQALEQTIGRKAQIEMLPLQPGDVPDTYADINALSAEIDFRPDTPIQHGINNFVKWYRDYYSV